MKVAWLARSQYPYSSLSPETQPRWLRKAIWPFQARQRDTRAAPSLSISVERKALTVVRAQEW